jgi:hypothetical protein
VGFGADGTSTMGPCREHHGRARETRRRGRRLRHQGPVSGWRCSAL